MCEPVAEMAGHFRRAPAAATSTRTLLGRVGLILTLKGDDLRRETEKARTSQTQAICENMQTNLEDLQRRAQKETELRDLGLMCCHTALSLSQLPLEMVAPQPQAVQVLPQALFEL